VGKPGIIGLCAVGGVVGALVLVPPALAAGTVTITGVQAVSGTEGGVANEQATFTDTNAPSPSNLSVTIDWGDGTGPDSTSPEVTQVGGFGGTNYTISADHTFAEEGSFVGSITVTENLNHANTDTAATTSTIADATLVTAGAPVSFSAAGSGGVASSMASFEAAIGGTNNGTKPGDQSGGFRHINWDGIALNGSAPGSTVISPGHVVAVAPTAVQSAGVVLPGPAAVAGDGFVSVNPTVASPLRFPAFSAPNVLASFNDSPLELDVVRPAGAASTPTPQASRGVGLVFLNVRQPNTTSVQYFDGSIPLLTAFAPVGGSAGQPSFLGELFPTAVVTRVVVSLGTAQIFNFDGTTSSSGPADNPPSENLVAADDVVLAEPIATTSSLNFAAVAGVPFSRDVGVFTDGDPNGTARDYRALVDWGDGSRSPGTVASAFGGNFTVSAGHTYTRPGSYAVTVTVTDFGGAQRTIQLTARVTLRSTTTRATCAPSSVRVRQSTTCTATVSDTQAGAKSKPRGQVTFVSHARGGFISGECTLRPTAIAGRSACSTTYIPDAVGSGHHLISVAYAGDTVHGASHGTTQVTVTAGR
jgi:hypothetical protein